MSLEPLWNADQLATYLGLSPKTIGRLVTSNPGRLPPRIEAMKVNRWHPETVREWALEQSRHPVKTTNGRPRVR